MLQYLQRYLNSGREFELRFGIVMLMDHYLDDSHIDMVLEQYDSVCHPGYYVKMAVAWGLSLCLVQYRNKTLRFLESCRLDDFTYNKMLQKAIESNRISPADKQLLRGLKRQKQA